MRLRILFSLALCLLAVGLTYLLPSGSAEVPQKEQAIPIQPGVMSKQQQEHSRLYKEFRTDKNIPELAATSVGDIVVEKTIYPPLGGGLPCDAPCNAYPHAFIKGIAYDADAVIIGAVKNNTSQLTEDKDFVFTDNEVRTERILKNNPNKPLQVGETITVTRPGGIVQLNGHTVKAVDTIFQQFETEGRYILFLRFIPNTGAYKAFSNGSFQVRNKSIVKLTSTSLWNPSEMPVDEKAFIKEVRDAIDIIQVETPKGYVKLY
jgi:hypothetical protein